MTSEVHDTEFNSIVILVECSFKIEELKEIATVKVAGADSLGDENFLAIFCRDLKNGKVPGIEPNRSSTNRPLT